MDVLRGKVCCPRLHGVHQAGIPGVLHSTRETGTKGDECFAGDLESKGTTWNGRLSV